VSLIAGPLGAYLYPQPARAGAPVAVLPAGLAVVGEVVQGEWLHNEGRWVRVTGYVWTGRLIEGYPVPRRTAGAR
jgi:hypothetical protein